MKIGNEGRPTPPVPVVDSCADFFFPNLKMCRRMNGLLAMFGSLFLDCTHTHNHFCTVHSPTFQQNELQKLQDALRETGETWEKGVTGLTGSTVLRHEIKPKMGEISNS